MGNLHILNYFNGSIKVPLKSQVEKKSLPKNITKSYTENLPKINKSQTEI